MTQSENPTIDSIHAIFAELGIIDPRSIATAQEKHVELIVAYETGKITEAALRHSLSRNIGRQEKETLEEPVSAPESE